MVQDTAFISRHTIRHKAIVPQRTPGARRFAARRAPPGIRCGERTSTAATSSPAITDTHSTTYRSLRLSTQQACGEMNLPGARSACRCRPAFALPHVRVIADLCDRLVLLVEDRHHAVQIRECRGCRLGNEEAARVAQGVRRNEPQVLAIEAADLESRVGAGIGRHGSRAHRRACHRRGCHAGA